MDLNLLSAETYDDGALNGANPQTEDHNGSKQWTGALGSNSTQARKLKQKELPANTRARPPSKRESSTINVDESHGARQRGRPRLDTRDQTAAEVYAPDFSLIREWRADRNLSYSVAVLRYDLRSEPIDSERRLPYPR